MSFKDAPAPVHAFLGAALQARGESASHASRGAGFDSSHLAAYLKRPGALMGRPNLDKYADYFRVSRAELRAIRGKSQERVRHGKAAGARSVSSQGVEKLRELAATARAKKAAMDPQVIAEHARRGALAAKAREENGRRKARLTAAAQRRKDVAAERGSWFTSPEVRERAVARMRAAGLRRAAGPEFDRYRYEFRQPGKRSVFVVLGTLGQIRQRVMAAKDPALLVEVDEQIRAELRHLRTPQAGGRPPMLLKHHRPLAIQMVLMQQEGGLSAGEVAALAGLDTHRDSAGVLQPGTKARRLFRLGRALLQRDRLPPGPRDRAA